MQQWNKRRSNYIILFLSFLVGTLSYAQTFKRQTELDRMELKGKVKSIRKTLYYAKLALNIIL